MAGSRAGREAGRSSGESQWFAWDSSSEVAVDGPRVGCRCRFYVKRSDLSIDSDWSRAVDEVAQGRGRNTGDPNTEELNKVRYSPCDSTQEDAWCNVRAPAHQGPPSMRTRPCKGDYSCLTEVHRSNDPGGPLLLPSVMFLLLPPNAGLHESPPRK